MRTFLLFLLPGVLSIAAAAPAPTAPAEATLVVFDASGSMRERIRGETKIEIARRAVRELVESLPDETRIGLVAYSHRRDDCDDIELLIPPGRLNRRAFIAAVDALQPKGRTPLSSALEFAAQALEYTKNKGSIVLLSDGLETCGRDPCAVALQLAGSAAGLTIHPVAFDLGAKEGRTFECIAAATNGRFLQANDAAALKDALVVAVAASAAPAEQLSPATVQIPDRVPAGSEFAAAWTGPDNPGDYLTIVPKGAPDESYVNSAYTRQGSPLTLTALIDPGDAEVRYIAARSRQILGRAPLVVTDVSATLSAPAKATAGAPVPVDWTGPANRGDYVTIVTKGAADDVFSQYAYVARGTRAPVAAPMDPGEAEIRYVSGTGRRILARRPLEVVAATVTLDASPEAVAGAEVSVRWTGPDNPDDFLTLMPKSAPDGAWSRSARTRQGTPAKPTAPIDPGEAEIRYISGLGRRVLARRPLRIVAATITLEAPAEVVAGAEVSVVWTGPNNASDFLTIMPKGSPDGSWSRTVYTRQGSPLRLFAPVEVGEAEIRYLSGDTHRVLGRRAVTIVAAVITLEAPPGAIAGAEVPVAWTGPNNANDFLTIVPKGSPDGSWGRTAYTRQGSPLRLVAPGQAGEAEIRYHNGHGYKVLARRPIVIEAAKVSLGAPAEVIAGSMVAITWSGPDNNGDFITIVPKSAQDGVNGRYAYTRAGSPARVPAPGAPGAGEIRYVNGADNRVLARIDITIAAP